MTIPDFALTVANTVDDQHDPEPQQRDHDDGDQERAFTGTVDDDRVHRLGRPDQPVRDDAVAADVHARSPATPTTTVTWATFNTTGAPAGIYTIWVQGHSSSPYLTDHYYPVAINIGGVNRDFSTHRLRAPSSRSRRPARPATGTMTFSTPNNNGTVSSAAPSP